MADLSDPTPSEGPSDAPEAPAHRPPVHIPPSVGGSALAVVSGLLLGRNVVEAFLLHTEVLFLAWVVPVVLIAFVAALVQFALMARARVGLNVSTRSIRRQWLVMAGAFAFGLLAGAAFPYVNGA